MALNEKNLFSSPKLENDEFSSFVELLRHRALKQTSDTAYVFLKDGEIEAARLTFGELDTIARAIAVHLQHSTTRGDRVAIAYPPGLDFIAAFCGCLYAGVVAVPVYPPARQNEWTRFEKIVTDAGVRIVLTTTSILKGIRPTQTSQAIDALQYIATDDIDVEPAHMWQDLAANPGDLAFLQYTSGSTGTPKGVAVSHGNLLHNQKIIKAGFQHNDKTIFVGWLPLYHDMGLIGNVFQPLYLGIPSILMAPAAFVAKPVRWLQAISTYRATTSGGPNFAYELCASRVTEEQSASLDLSSWEVAFNGSEMIRDDTLRRFADKFTPRGFRKSSFLCCYGLAESTLFVTGNRCENRWSSVSVDAEKLQRHQVITADDDAPSATKLVGCGIANDLDLRIVDPATRDECAAGMVGEIWVKGASVAQGYWNDKVRSEATFSVTLAGSGDGPYMRTGDLGFLKDGELYVTGRLKDLIIIRGRNYYSQDIESTVQASHPSLRIDGGAAFAIDVDGAESLVVVQEVNRTHGRSLDVATVTGAVRAAMVMDLGLPLYDFVLLKQGSVPKTTSGKIRRSACRDAYLAGALTTFYPDKEAHIESEGF